MSDINKSLDFYASIPGIMSKINPGIIKGAQDFYNVLFSMCRSPESRAVMTAVASNREVADDAGNTLLNIIATAATMYRGNYNRLIQMYKEYNNAMIRKGYVDDPDQFEQYDRIDAVDLVHETHASMSPVRDAVSEYINRVGFYAYIPCFQKGVLDFTENAYIVWETANIDLNGREMELVCTVYMRKEYFGSGYDKDVIYGNFKVKLMYMNRSDPDMHPLDCCIAHTDLIEMFSVISPKAMKWNRADRLAWTRVFMRMARFVESVSANPVPHDLILSLMEYMTFAFAGTNYFLHKNKYCGRKRHGPSQAPDIIADYNEEKQNERRVHKVGMVTISGTTVPRESTRESVIRYQVASWGVRGHMRRLKDGKLIYIRPHVRCRHCLEDAAKEATPSARTVSIVNNSEVDDALYSVSAGG